MTTEAIPAQDRAPTAAEFAAELIPQLYAELDGVLFEAGAAQDEALGLAVRAAQRGAARGAVLAVLAQGAIAAHRRLLPELAALSDEAEEQAEALAQLAPGAPAQLAALLGYGPRLEALLATGSRATDPLRERLGALIERFYAALGEDDGDTGRRCLIELRALVVHLDAAAQTLDAVPVAAEPISAQRPDRFHDHFLRYANLAQTPDGAPREAPVATLTRDGKITAVITQDSHPLEAAERAVREQIEGDDHTRDHTLARLRALLEFLDALRRRPAPGVGDPVANEGVRLSLTLAAASTPLFGGQGFVPDALAQVARYNQILLRLDVPRPAARH